MAYIYEENGTLKIAESRTERIKDLILAEFDEDNIFTFFDKLDINIYISIMLNTYILEYFNNIILYKLNEAPKKYHDSMKKNLKINLENYNYKTGYKLDEEIKKIFNYCY